MQIQQLLTEVFPLLVRYTGLGIAAYETLIERADRPSLLLLAAGMMGLPTFMEFVGVKEKK